MSREIQFPDFLSTVGLRRSQDEKHMGQEEDIFSARSALTASSAGVTGTGRCICARGIGEKTIRPSSARSLSPSNSPEDRSLPKIL